MLNFIKSLFGIKKTFIEKVYIPEEKIDTFIRLYDSAGSTYASNRELWKFIYAILKDKKDKILVKHGINSLNISMKIKMDPLSPYIEMTYKI